MIKYIVCVPQKWDERQVAIPYSVQAKTPKTAAKIVFATHPNLFAHCNGEITVVEAKAGRLDNWFHYYHSEDLQSEEIQ